MQPRGLVKFDETAAENSHIFSQTVMRDFFSFLLQLISPTVAIQWDTTFSVNYATDAA